MYVTYDDAAAFEVGFNSHFLADWRDIADGAQRLLRSLRSSTPLT